MMKTDREIKAAFVRIQREARNPARPHLKADGRVFVGGDECKPCTEKRRALRKDNA